MKKLLTIIFATLLTIGCVFGLTACGSGNAIKIGAQTDTTGYLLSTYLKGTESYAYANPALAIADMKSGNLDYVIVDKAVAANLCENTQGVKYIDVALTNQEEFAMAVDKGQSGLLESINGVLASKESEINAIKAKYLEGDSANFVGVEGVEKNNANPEGQLVVATNAEYPPFEYVEGNKFYGIDMEIAKLLADELNLELVIEDMQFEAVVTSVGANNVDIGLAALTVTAEREALVNFSDTYHYNYQVVVVLEDNTELDEAESVMDVLAVLCANK